MVFSYRINYEKDGGCMTTETAIEESPEYKQVKQRIKQANINMMQAIKFDQGMHGYDGRIDLGFSKRKTSIFIYGLLAILLTWALIGAYHYYDALYSVLALVGV